MKVRLFVALPADADHHVADRLKVVMKIGDADVVVSKAKTSKTAYNELASLYHRSFGLSDLVIVADKASPFAQKMDYGFLTLISQHCNLRYWTIDSTNHESVHRILRKAALVVMSEHELVYRAQKITGKYAPTHKEEAPLRPGDNCF